MPGSEPSKRLLVVDDDDDILEVLAIILAEAYVVTTARDGRQALALLQRQEFDALVLDLMMPVMGGETVIRMMDEASLRIPTVLASAIPDLATVAERLGVEFILKPYDMAALQAKLSAIFRRTDAS